LIGFGLAADFLKIDQLMQGRVDKHMVTTPYPR
jgi:hypothetical protein